ncbi:hypothetical protein AAVH_11221, partial [Aphelenchoides avenae]
LGFFWRLVTTLNEYYDVMNAIYKVTYGSDFFLPVVFKEDFEGNLTDYASMHELAHLRPDKVDTCGGNVERSLLEAFFNTYSAYLLSTAFNEASSATLRFYPCPISVTPLHCREMVGNNSEYAVLDDLVMDEERIDEEGRSFYVRATIDLMVTFNATVNPATFVQYYSDEDHLRLLAEVMYNISQQAAALKDALGRVDASNECAAKKLESLDKILSSPIMLFDNESSVEAGAWFRGISDYCRLYRGLNIMDGYVTTNLAMITLVYKRLTHQEVAYSYQYTFWQFLSEVGGNLGLYFGLTIVTVYEMIVFTCIDRERSGMQPEKKFSTEVLYEKDNANDQALPTIAYSYY